MAAKFAYHGALAPLDDACRMAGEGFLCVSRLMADNGGRSGFFRKLTIAWRHLGLIPFVLRHKQAKFILFRDFSNIPLAAVFPLIRWKRRELFFLINHNLQWALADKLERKALRLLVRWGCRLVFLETVPSDVLTRVGLPEMNFKYLPHPVPSSNHVRDRSGGVEVVGIVGQYRPEKGIDELLQKLEPLADRYRVVLALPNPDAFRSQSRYASADWFRLVDTSGFEDYQRTLAECDVIVLNHPADHYSCRASGLIADAASARVPVVVRNLPLLRHQVDVPSCIGECFDATTDVPDCIGRVSEKLSRGEYDFYAYRAGRSVSALVPFIREMGRP